jgi:hypothetical protein
MGRTGAIKAQVRATMSRQNFSQRGHQIHPIGPQTHILGCLKPFRYCTNFGAKPPELVQLIHKFGPRSRVTVFLQRAH